MNTFSNPPVECADCRFQCGYNEAFDNFERVAGGFAPTCKACDQKREVANVMRTRRDAIKALDAYALNQLAKAKPGGATAPHISALLAELTSLGGGVQGMAAHWWATFLAAKPGSATRQKMMQQYIAVVQGATQLGGTKIPVNQMDEEELEQELAARGMAVMRYKEEIPAVKPTEGDDGEEDARPSV